MKYLPLSLLILMTSCANIPSLFTAAEDIADDTAIKIEVSREALENNPDISLEVNIKNVAVKK